MENAARALDAAIDNAAGEVRRAYDMLSDIEKDQEPVTDEAVEQFRDYVTGPGRTPAWDAVARRIASGEISWRAVVDGELALDEGVRAAFETSPRITSLDAADAVAPSDPAHDEKDQKPGSMSINDDDYFNDLSPFD